VKTITHSARRHLRGEAREQMILKYASLVRQVLGRMAVVLPQALDRDDLLGYGTLGLIEAVDRFDPTQGVAFESFAAARIRGSILDALRAADWVPRSARKRGRDIQRVFMVLEERLGRASTDEEVAGALDLTLAQLQRAMADAVSTVVSLERPLLRAAEGDETPMTLLDLVQDSEANPWLEVEQRDLRESIAAAIAQLSEREQVVLSLYYEQGRNLREIGEVLSICESRVWQLHARAITRIRGYIDVEIQLKQQVRRKKGA
jgi:RNA polymerase sigma factor for flagellar operon FliA